MSKTLTEQWPQKQSVPIAGFICAKTSTYFMMKKENFNVFDVWLDTSLLK